MKSLKERIDIETAALDGKPIEQALIVKDRAWHLEEIVHPDGYIFDWRCYDYRIKPEPLVLWVNVYPSSPPCAYEDEAGVACSPNFGGKTIKMVEADA